MDALLLVAATAPAAKAVQVGQAVPQTAGLGGTLMALGVVVGLILFLAFVLKKLPGAGISTDSRSLVHASASRAVVRVARCCSFTARSATPIRSSTT